MQLQNWPHWLKVHREVSKDVWGTLTDDIRDIISNDGLHLTETYKWFVAHCEAETNRLSKRIALAFVVVDN